MSVCVMLVLLGATGAGAAHADTYVGYSKITQDTTWTKAGSPYRLEDAVSIAPGVTLTIEAGTEVVDEGIFEPAITGQGTLDVRGTAADPVFMTDVSLATAHMRLSHLWNRARRTNDKAVRLSPDAVVEHSVFEDTIVAVGNQGEDWSGGGQYSVTITDTTFRGDTWLRVFPGTTATGEVTVADSRFVAGARLLLTSRAPVAVDVRRTLFQDGRHPMLRLRLAGDFRASFIDNTIANGAKEPVTTEVTPGPGASWSFANNRLEITPGRTFWTHGPRIAGGPPHDLDIGGNWWNGFGGAGIDGVLYDGRDAPGIGVLRYAPILDAAPVFAPPRINPPETTITGPADRNVDPGPVDITFETTGASFAECRYGLTWQPCTSPFRVQAPQTGQSRTVEVRGVAANGVPDPTPAEITLVGVVRPVVSITSGPAEGQVTGSPETNFVFTVNPSRAKLACTVNGVAVASCASPLTVTGLPDGPNSIEIKATDDHGITGTLRRDWIVDTVPPTAPVIQKPADGAILPGSPVEVRWKPSQDQSQVTYLVEVDGELQHLDDVSCTPTQCSGTVALQGGRHTLRVVARDAVANTSASASRTVMVDQGPPSAPVLTEPAQNATVGVKPDFVWNASSDATPVTYRLEIDGAERGWQQQGCAGSRCVGVPSGNLKPGSHSVRIVARDALGNETASTPRSISVVAAGIAISPASQTFPEQWAGGESPKRTVTVSNPSSEPVTIGQVAITGRDPGQFRLAGDKPSQAYDTCSGRSLAPGETCFMRVRFRPTSAGTKAAVLRVPVAGGSSGASVLGGTANAALTVDPAARDFGVELVGVEGTKRTFTVVNQSGAPVAFGQSEIVGEDAGQFRMAGDKPAQAFDTCSGRQLAAGASCFVRIRFKPTEPGPVSAQLRVPTTSPVAVVTSEMTGRGTGLRANPTAWEFTPGKLEQKSFNVVNVLPTSMTLGSAEIVGLNASQFRVNKVCNGVTLAPGASCKVRVDLRARAAWAADGEAACHRYDGPLASRRRPHAALSATYFAPDGNAERAEAIRLPQHPRARGGGGGPPAEPGVGRDHLRDRMGHRRLG